MGPNEPDRLQLANGGFDHNITGWDSPGRMSLTWNADEGRGKAGCLQAVATQQDSHNTIRFSGSFLMHADRRYRCAFWAKSPTCRSPFLFTVFDPEETAEFENPPLSHEWQRYSFPIFVPLPHPPPLTIFYRDPRLVPRAIRKGEIVFIDDVTIFDVELGPTAPVSAERSKAKNMLSDSGAFAAGLNGWKDNGTRMKYTFVPGDGHDAKGCLKAQSVQTDGWNYITYKGAVGTLETGKQYRIGWHAKSPNSTASFVVHHAMLYGLTEESKVSAISNPKLSPSWQQYEIRYVPARMSTVPSLSLILPPVAGAEVCVDDVYLVEVE